MSSTVTSFLHHLFASIERARSLEQLLQEPLGWALSQWNVSGIVLMVASKGAWKRTLQLGKVSTEPPDWNVASECLDSRKEIRSALWSYFPVPASTIKDLVVCCQPAAGASLSPLIAEQIGLIAAAIDNWHRQQQKSRDVIRLNQILNVAADWHSHQDLDRLLQDIAQAATRLLRCDRASIFLWDKPSRELVGHPALGIEGKPLRIADDKGLAGAVLKSLQPRRWDRSDPHDEVDRRVDTSSGYRTDSLLAVPLIDTRSKPMGVFEVINHTEGRFDAQDESDLIELARHASAALANTQQLQRLVQTRDRLTKDAQQQVQL
ncbi:MAG: GAF domain-containing protein, partial [Pirellula sp.]